jgi:hypothetical protein
MHKRIKRLAIASCVLQAAFIAILYLRIVNGNALLWPALVLFAFHIVAVPAAIYSVMKNRGYETAANIWGAVFCFPILIMLLALYWQLTQVTFNGAPPEPAVIHGY